MDDAVFGRGLLDSNTKCSVLSGCQSSPATNIDVTVTDVSILTVVITRFFFAKNIIFGLNCVHGLLQDINEVSNLV